MDLFTIDVIQASLKAIANEMFAVLKRTAMSPIIYEVLDSGVAITDNRGRLACSGAGIPSFIGVLDKAVKALIEDIPGEEIQPGDVFCTNDPYRGGVTHSSDVILMVPVFSDDQIIAWTSNIAHWSDIGGSVAGSLSTEAKDIFSEGLRLPLIRLLRDDEDLSGIFDIIKVNSRLPETTMGDLWAGISSARRGAIRIQELVSRYGVDLFNKAINDSFDVEQKRVISGLAKLRHGSYKLRAKRDDGEDLPVEISIEADKLRINLEDAPDQDDGPYNTSRDSAIIAGQMLLKIITTPGSSANDGSFRALEVLTRKGSCFDPISPAAQGYYFEVRMTLFDLLLRCLAEGMPDKFPAGHFGSICSTVVSGLHPDHGRRYTLVEPQMGGWGASKGQDGIDAMFSLTHGDTYRCPAEITESRYGLFVEQIALNPSPGGGGTWRGGRGLSVDYRLRAKAELSIGFSKSVIAPWGLKDGENGSFNYVEIERRNSGSSRYSSQSGISCLSGDLIKIRTGSGGGWGASANRRQEAKKTDKKNELDVGVL